MLNVTRNFLWRLATIIELRRYGRLSLATAEFFVPLSILAVVLRRIDMKPHRVAHGENQRAVVRVHTIYAQARGQSVTRCSMSYVCQWSIYLLLKHCSKRVKFLHSYHLAPTYILRCRRFL